MTSQELASGLDPYALLGVTLSSSPVDVRRAYYRLALLVHPDKGGSAEEMAIVRTAYAWICRGLTAAATQAPVTLEPATADFQAFLASQVTERIRPLSDILAESFGISEANFADIFTAAAGATDTPAITLYDQVYLRVAYQTIMSRLATVMEYSNAPDDPLPVFQELLSEFLKHHPTQEMFPSSVPGGYGDLMDASAPAAGTGAAADDALVPVTNDFGPRDLINYTEPDGIFAKIAASAPEGVPETLADYTVYNTMGDYKTAFQVVPTSLLSPDPNAPPPPPETVGNVEAAYLARIAERIAERTQKSMNITE